MSEEEVQLEDEHKEDVDVHDIDLDDAFDDIDDLGDDDLLGEEAFSEYEDDNDSSFTDRDSDY